MGKYDDIIDIQYVKSKKYPHMSIENRAGQFAPFAALTGHKESVLETERYVDKKIILDEDKKIYLDNMLNVVSTTPNLFVKVTYFVKDKYKEGGMYTSKTGYIKKIDYIKKLIVFMDKTVINIDNIVNISIEKALD